MNRSSRSLPPLAPLVASAALLATACGGESRAKPSAERPRAVTIAVVRERLLPRTVVATGALLAEERADLGFKVSGRLAKLPVDLGSRVAEGDALAALEPSDYELRKERARAALLQARSRLGLSPDENAPDDVVAERTAVVRQAKARFDEAAAQRERSRSLLADGLLSQASFDVVDANFKVAESQYHDALEEVNNRRAALAEKRSDFALALQQLADTVLRAPFSGSVQARRANVGEFLGAGSPVLVLVKLSPIRLRLEIPEREARFVKKGQTVVVKTDGDAATHRGAVARLSPALDDASRTLVVEAEIPNPKGALRPGAFARAEIETEGGAPTLVAPASALVVFAGIEKVLVVQDDKAAERPVTTGRRSGELVEIASGLAAGDRVVVRPGNLTTGARVEVTAEAAGPAATP